MADDAKALSDAVFQMLDGGSPLGEEAAAAIGEYTRDKMWRLRHIPNRYYLTPDLAEHLPALYAEIERRGYIALDADGEPAVLTGKPPKLPHPETTDAAA